MAEHGKGELVFAVLNENGKIRMEFNHSVRWLGMTPEQAIRLGEHLIKEGHMMNEFWNARRIKLEKAVIKATLDLFEHTNAQSFKLLLDPPSQILFIVAGDVETIQSLLPKKET